MLEVVSPQTTFMLYSLILHLLFFFVILDTVTNAGHVKHDLLRILLFSKKSKLVAQNDIYR